MNGGPDCCNFSARCRDLNRQRAKGFDDGKRSTTVKSRNQETEATEIRKNISYAPAASISAE
jgi:hypothetical protein